MKCPKCGWINPWTDSGDRGMAQDYHDKRECPGREDNDDA